MRLDVPCMCQISRPIVQLEIARFLAGDACVVLKEIVTSPSCVANMAKHEPTHKAKRELIQDRTCYISHSINIKIIIRGPYFWPVAVKSWLEGTKCVGKFNFSFFGNIQNSRTSFNQRAVMVS